MSVQSEIDRINGNVASTYSVLEEAGAEMPQSRNTDHLPETVANFATASKQKYGKLVVFGDSVGEGVNNDNYSYVDMLRESGLFSSVVKACVGGATVGPYQLIDSAFAYDLCSQIERYASDIQDADIILLEYGANDVNAVTAGNIQMGTAFDDMTTTTTVCGWVQRAIEYIRGFNPSAKIHWVNVMPTDWDYVNRGADTDSADNGMLFMATALRKCALAGMYIIQAPFSYIQYLSSDNLHPNTAGHKHITALILNGLFGNNYVFPHERVATLVGSPADLSTLSANAKHKNLKNLIEAGVKTRAVIRFEFDGSTTMMEAQLATCNDYQVSFSVTNYNGTDPYPVFAEAKILADDTVNCVMYPIGSVS